MIDYGADVNLKDGTGNAPIHLACRSGASFERDIFAKLLEKGADMTLPNINGDTPFHLAIFHQNFRAVVKMMTHQVVAMMDFSLYSFLSSFFTHFSVDH